MVSITIVLLVLAGSFLQLNAENCRSPITAQQCQFIAKRDIIERVTKAGAQIACADMGGVLLPDNSDTGHIANYKEYFGIEGGVEICGEIWTSLSYDNTTGSVNAPNGDFLGIGDYTWESGEPPVTSEPCLAAKRLGNYNFSLFPKSCTEEIGYACVVSKAACTCSTEQTCVPVYKVTCSHTCLDKTTTVPTTSAVTSTLTSTSDSPTTTSENPTTTTETPTTASTTITSPTINEKPGTSTTVESTSSKDIKTSGSLSTGAIVGIVGSLTALILGIIIVLGVKKCRGQHSRLG
ncbi:uncharacterized protein LOC120342613 isoform X1 [Styela clava]